ncbi:MAG: DUF1499 domain-containing protein [Rhizobiales bacterium]|nr:DUF1499 domain-containing protein [Hyphomicrobiales bacterium]
MARRIIYDQGTSRLALWARRLALFALAAAILSVIIVHSGLLEMRPALVTFGASLALAVLALFVAFAGFVSIWREGLLGMGASLSAIAIAALVLAYPTYIAVKARNLPWIYDITTDPIDPPRYDTLAKVRLRDANPIVYPGLTMAELQHEAYPDIEPLDTDIDTRSAYNAALAVINRRRWRVVEARAPDQGRPEGRIEAVARTPIMGFRDDVIVRVRPFEDGARVDVRSSSRYGQFDFGTNAARIRALLEDLEAEFVEQASDEPPPIARPKASPKNSSKNSPKNSPKNQLRSPPKAVPKTNQPTANR